MEVDLLECLSGKWEDGTRPKNLFSDYVRKQPKKYVDEIVRGLGAGNRRIENGCAELASLLSEELPELLYPYVEVFIENLGSKKKVMRWEAACTLGNLARADDGGRIPSQISILIVFLRDKSIVLQGHSLRALAKIASAFPRESKKIFTAMVEAADAFPGNKVGFVIEAMEPFIVLGGFDDPVRRFVEPFSESETKVVARKAGKILKRIERERKKR